MRPQQATKRTYFLESHGYDKDADHNTYAGTTVEPLPFFGMQSYPFSEDDTPPQGDAYEAYREQWLTRTYGDQDNTPEP